MASSAEVHGTLDHPVIDSDGHMAEHLPTLAPYLEQEGLSLEDPSLRQLVPPYGGTDVQWHDQTPEQRSDTRTPRGPWWGSPARQTIDLATALFPALLYERLDELGFDFGVVYPSIGLVFLHTPDDQRPGSTAIDLQRGLSVQVRVVPVHAGRIVGGDAEAVLKRRVGILDVGVNNLVLMAQRRNIEPVKMDVG